MKNQQQQKKIQQEVLDFIQSRKSLQLASLLTDGASPYASYAPFAVGEDRLYVLISDIAVHAQNLAANGKASVLIIEDEDSARELFARKRVNYQTKARLIKVEDDEWKQGIAALAERHGERIDGLSQLSDFKLFSLTPESGRYVKGFGRAFAMEGQSLSGDLVDHMRDGHKKRDVA